MIVVADSGSTKTLWALAGTSRRWAGAGLNPLFADEATQRTEMDKARRQLGIAPGEATVHFYGAGCGQPAARERVGKALEAAFGTEAVEVATDMLGACRAMCGREAGVVGILGTGSNCCCFDGRSIAFQPVSTGYILGDQGSANHVGRRLLADYLGGRMPDRLASRFREAFPLNHEQFLEAVYRKPNANRFLASLAPFALHHETDPYCLGMVAESLGQWYDTQLEACLQRAGRRDFCLVGGFAAAIGMPMQRFLQAHGLRLQAVAANPMDGLLAYHAGE
mgnify:CR=1 FL=1